jgi:hypothetical protein
MTTTDSAQRGTESPLHNRVVFLVGAQRSGTNWLQRMLATHPAVASVPSETCLFSHGIAPLTERFHHGPTNSTTTGFVYMDPVRLRDSLRRFCDDVLLEQIRMLDPDASRVLERTPMHVHHLALLTDIYPDAWVIHIIRDGVDVARSLMTQPWGPATIGEAAHEWASAIRDARSVTVPRYREVRYEQLLEQPVAGVSDLLAWLELPVDDERLAAIERIAERQFNVTRGLPGVMAGKWRGQLSPQDAAAVIREAGPVLSELGYPVPEVGSPAPAPADAADAADAADGADGPSRPATTLRDQIGRARDALRRVVDARRRTDPKPPSPDFKLVTSQLYMATLGLVVDRFVQAIALRRYDELRDLIAPGAQVTVADRRRRHSAEGQEGIELLVRRLAEDEPRRHELVRDDAVKTAVGATVVQTHAAGDGSLSETVHILQGEWTGQTVLLSKVLVRLGTGT